MKRTFLLILSFFALSAVNGVRAQSTIGDLKAPYQFSVLELITVNHDRGLRLPQMTTDERDAMTATTYFTAEITGAAKGLMIFNTTINCVETWNGSQWISECALSEPAAPIAPPEQSFCGPHTLSDLSVNGQGVRWYTASTGGTQLGTGTALTDGTTYYASQTVNGLESSSRTAVLVHIYSEPSITGSTTSVEVGSTLSLSVTPAMTGIWYSSNDAIADVSNSGVVTGVATGTATIYFVNTTTNCAADPYFVTVTPVGTPTTKLQILCDSLIQFNNGHLISAGVTFAAYPDCPIIYVKVNNLTGSTLNNVVITADRENMHFTVEPGKTAFNIPPGYSWIKLYGSGYPPAAARGMTVWLEWTVSAAGQPYEFVHPATATRCGGVAVDAGYGELSIIFGDNNGSGKDNWGPGSILTSTRSCAIIGAGIFGLSLTGGSNNFKPNTTGAMDARFKLYGNGFPWTLSVGNSGQDTDAAAALQMYQAVSLNSLWYAGEIPDVIVHAKENIGPPSSQPQARQLLNAYHMHVKQGGWLIYTSRNWNQSGNLHTQYILDSLGISHGTLVNNTSTAGFTVNPTAGTPAYDLCDGFFGNVVGGRFDVDNNNGSIIVPGLPSWCYPIISTSQGAVAFVAKNPDWKGGFIFLGRNCDANILSNVSQYDTYYRPYRGSSSSNNQINSKLEMNALGYIIEQNRATDTNMTPPSPLAPTI
jgi:hypothetical protein